MSRVFCSHSHFRHRGGERAAVAHLQARPRYRAIVGKVDGLEAVNQFILKALLTPRFHCLSTNTSTAAKSKDTVTDESATEELIRAEIPRLVEDALLCDGRILKVYDFEFEFNEDSCNVHFTADTIYGTTEVEEVI